MEKVKGTVQIICIFLLIISLGCNETHDKSQPISHEIELLNSTKKQRQFLNEIYRLDQEVRKNETTQGVNYGYKSEEHREAIKKMMDTDELNLKKIELYLKKYGHPKIDLHGKEACNVPWLIIHHAMNGIEPRRRNFTYIYLAYKNGDIDDGAISFYLNRMYDIQFGEMINWDRPFRIEEELDTLFKSLELMDLVQELNENGKKN